MIEQCLSNKNKNTAILKSKKFCKLNAMDGHLLSLSLVPRRRVRSCLCTQKPKTLQGSPSHRILRNLHGTLNIYKKGNQLQSLSVNHDTNLLSLVIL